MRQVLGKSITVVLTAVTAVTVVGASPPTAVADTVCDRMDRATWHVARPDTGASLLTPWADEATKAAAYGFTDPQGTPFRSSVTPRVGLVAVDRMFSSRINDFQWVVDGSTAQREALAAGYADQGPGFYASGLRVPGCTRAIASFVRQGRHRYAPAAEAPALLAAGWVRVRTAFHAPLIEPSTAPPADPVFTFAVMPDTQNEVNSTDIRFPKRVDWLVTNRALLDLRWVLHSGDLQNWDTPAHEQFANMSRWIETLEANGLPFLAVPGNHDTAAVCPGGSACPNANTNVTVRDTRTWNAYYPPYRFGLQGVYETGKSDNGWRTFSAGGVGWLVLDLELWPRTGVIDWAKNVVATHPHHNVIVVTHSFLTSKGAISASNGGYGATAPTALWAALDDFPNVVMFFSGHVGQAFNTSATAVDGHKVAMFLQTMHAPYTNPVRLVTVDTRARTIHTWVRSNVDRSYPVGQQDVTRVYPYTATISLMRWVR